MLEIGNLFKLSIKDCMFNTSITKNLKGAPLPNLVVFGHAHGLGKASLLVLFGRLHHSPPLALHLNLNPNRFFYLMPNPPTQS